MTPAVTQAMRRAIELAAMDADRTCIARYKPFNSGRGNLALAAGRTVQVFLGSRGSHRVTPGEARLLAAELLASATEAEAAAKEAANGA